MCRIDFLFRFIFGLVFEKKLGFHSEWVWFDLKNVQFGSDIIAVYYLSYSKYYSGTASIVIIYVLNSVLVVF